MEGTLEVRNTLFVVEIRESSSSALRMTEFEDGRIEMRNYLAAPLLVGAAFAVLYGFIGVAVSVFDVFGWIDEMKFHIVGVHFEGIALFAVSLALLLLAAGAMLYLTGGDEQLV